MFATAVMTVGIVSAVTADPSEPMPDNCVDGKKNPAQIPDDVAIRMALNILGDGPASFDWKTRSLYVAGFGLTESQIASVLYAANDWRSADRTIARKSAALMQGQARDTALATGIADQLKANAAERIRVCDRIVFSLETELGNDAWAKFLRFVSEKVKPTITHCHE